MCGERGEPRVAVTGVAGEVDALLARLLVPRHVPRLEAEPVEDHGQLVRRGRIVEVAALGVGDPGRVQRVTGGTALGARRVDPDLHGQATSISVAPVMARSSSYVVEKTAAG